MDENAVDSEVEVSEERPTITHDEYLELVSMRQSLLELKAQKADVLEFVNVAQQQLNALNEALNENSSALQERMREIVTPLGITGEFTIVDSEPHFIVPNA
jgi:hypothetical protein